MSSHSSGRMSANLVSQSNFVKLGGRAVTFLPLAKSSIRIPTDEDRNAFEHDARVNNVCAREMRSKKTNQVAKEVGTYVYSHDLALFTPDPVTSLFDHTIGMDDPECKTRDLRILDNPRHERIKPGLDEFSSRSRLKQTLDIGSPCRKPFEVKPAEQRDCDNAER